MDMLGMKTILDYFINRTRNYSSKKLKPKEINKQNSKVS